MHGWNKKHIYGFLHSCVLSKPLSSPPCSPIIIQEADTNYELATTFVFYFRNNCLCSVYTTSNHCNNLVHKQFSDLTVEFSVLEGKMWKRSSSLQTLCFFLDSWILSKIDSWQGPNRGEYLGHPIKGQWYHKILWPLHNNWFTGEACKGYSDKIAYSARLITHTKWGFRQSWFTFDWNDFNPHPNRKNEPDSFLTISGRIFHFLKTNTKSPVTLHELL